MSSSLVFAAWHAGMTRSNPQAALCVALGCPQQVFEAHQLADVHKVIALAQQSAVAGNYVVGGVAYEAAPAFDPALPVQPSPGFPLAEFHVFSPSQIELWSTAKLSGLAPSDGFNPWLSVSSGHDFNRAFNQVRVAIEQGEFYQINLTTRLRANNSHHESWALFQHLYLAQPAEQSLYLRGRGFNAISLSPELFFDWDGTTLKTAPMKGTRKPQQGGFGRLSDSEKDRAENVMIVDLLRNDLAKVCKPRSVQVVSLFDVMHLPTVDQMTSSISGDTRPGTTLADVFAALFPCGSVTGAPKKQSMLRIAQWEQAPRKLYCGALGVLSPGGHARFNVPIRTVIEQNAQLEYGVGSGITWYSTPEDEHREWWQKTEFLRQATRDFQLLETLRLENGHWHNLSAHIARMQHSADVFAFSFQAPAVLDQLLALAQSYPAGEYRGRLLCTATGETAVEVYPFEHNQGPVTLRMANAPMRTRPEFLLNKTTHRPEYDHFAAQAQPGEFDVLLFNARGYLTESCRCNLLLKINGKFLTPQICDDTQTYLLPGVLRARLLGENTIQQARLTIEDLTTAEEVWLINSLRGWIPVAQVLDVHGGVLFPSG